MSSERRYLLERVDDVAVVQLYADGFAGLSLHDKVLAWHLYLAALAGRDIYYDQRHPLGLEMRVVLEAMLTHGRELDAKVLGEIRRYTKLFWINSGPYNNVTARKFVLRLTRQELLDAASAAARAGAVLSSDPVESVERLIDRLAPMFLDPTVDPTVTNKTPGPGRDMLTTSANNLYAGVSVSHLENFTERYGLNSRLTVADGRLVEEVYRVGGRYDREIRRIVCHLRDAILFATPSMADALTALIRFYESGEDADRVAYDIAWVRDQDSAVDTINGFVEVYMDPRGVKGAWEGIVSYVHEAKTRDIQALAAHAQWFEDRMPWDARFRKPDVAGVTARAIEVVVETGDSGPLTAVGINLPNDQAIRERHGSKSVSLINVSEAYERSTPEAMRVEFSWSTAEAERAVRWGGFAQELTTAMHEVIGHGSGRMAPGVTEPPHKLLGEHYSAIEEARADLVALYFLPDPKLVELGIIAAEHHDDVVATEFEYYVRNALLQLRRVREGSQLEEDHMRNRHMIVNWLRAHTSAVEIRRRDGNTYFVMVDAAAFREGVGRLLGEVQRIKGEGDARAARDLFETYGVHFDPALRDEIVGRVDRLKLPSYSGFVMPRLEARRDDRGAIVDVEISYPCDLETQMLEYLPSDATMFSNRLPLHAEINPLSRALAGLRGAGVQIADLTESNPTTVGIGYPADLFDLLSAEHVQRYDPQPLGMLRAREAVAADYARRGARVDPEQVVLSASSSEAYSWLFKLLCDPGDAVLVPQPSYPLFEHLTRLEGVHAIPYHLRYHGRWEIDFDSINAAPAHVRGLLLVSPNNPTGSYVTRDEAQRLADICRSRRWAIVADEVFADFPLDSRAPPTEIVMNLDVLSFTLGGASKSLGLPQIKLGWMVVGGPAPERAEALAALEIVADTFLSVGTSVQGAAPSLLARGEIVRDQIRRRATDNLACARDVVREYPACTLLPVEGGWSLVVRIPAVRSEEALTLELLERERVLVHPGYFFDFPHEAYIVVSLLPRPEQFADAFARTLRFASEPGSSLHEHKG